MDNYLGEIRAFGFGYVPEGWAACDGASLPVRDNQALYSVIGNFFGGDTKKFNLPDLRGRVPLHAGHRNQLLPTGQAGGVEAVVLSGATVPMHTHVMNGSSAEASTSTASNASLGVAQPDADKVTQGLIYSKLGATANASLNKGSVETSGGSSAHPNMQPFAVLTFCIALTGEYPPRGDD